MFGLDREPYLRWTNHIGTPTEAVVHVRVALTDAETGEKEVRAGSGFVVRCDGFVLVPAQMMNPEMITRDGQTRRVVLENLKTTLTFAAADGPVPAPQIVPFPRFWTQSRRIGFALVKVNDLHFKGIPLLDPRNIRAGQSVQVVYAIPAVDDPGRARAVSVPATVGAMEAKGTGFAFAESPALPRVPPGALVVDSGSQTAIGIVPGTPREGQRPEPAPGFVTFARFHDISNAVGLLPQPPARDSADPEKRASDGEEGMVWIPGGPVALVDLWAKDYAALYGKWVVCTPGFWIDRREVTNEEYLTFLRETRRAVPADWEELSESAWWRESPVLGISTGNAAAYAAWRGKRLATPVEWARASAGAEVRFAEYLNTLERTASALVPRLANLDMQEATTIRLQLMQAEAQRRALLQDRRSRSLLNRGGAIIQNDGMDVQGIRAERLTLLEGFNEAARYPREVVPAGWREWDRSVWGVQDVALNVYELLQPNFAQRSAEIASKQIPTLIAPGVKARYGAVGPGGATSIVFAYPGIPLLAPVHLPGEPFLRYFDRDKWLEMIRGGRTSAVTEAFVPPTRNPDGTLTYPDWRIGIPADRNGFRCAR